MGLKKLTSALLPAAYREQVLGDLHERGFRGRDVASVLPRVWASHVHRSWAVPNLAGASDNVIERRITRLEAWRTRWMTVWITVAATSTWLDAKRGEMERWFWMAMMAAVFVAIGFRIFYPRVPKPEPAPRRYRTLLMQLQDSAQFGGPYFMVVIASGRFTGAMWGRNTSGPLELAGIVACFFYGQYRARRLQKELDSIA